MFGNAWKLIALCLLGVCIGFYIQIYGFPVIGGGLKHDLSKMVQLRHDEVLAHRKTKENYRLTISEAARMATERDARINLERQKVSHDAQISYGARLAGLRGTYERLLRERGEANGVSGLGGPLPSVSGIASGTGEEADAYGLSLAERYECSAYATQLDEVILLWQKHQNVPVN